MCSFLWYFELCGQYNGWAKLPYQGKGEIIGTKIQCTKVPEFVHYE